jgi:hypothetical protein
LPFLNELFHVFEIDQQITHLGRGQRLAFGANLIGDLRLMDMRLHEGQIVTVLVGLMALQPLPKQYYHFAQISRSLHDAPPIFRRPREFDIAMRPGGPSHVTDTGKVLAP